MDLAAKNKRERDLNKNWNQTNLIAIELFKNKWREFNIYPFEFQF